MNSRGKLFATAVLRYMRRKNCLILPFQAKIPADLVLENHFSNISLETSHFEHRFDSGLCLRVKADLR